MLSSPAIDQNEIVRNLKSKLHDRMAARAVLLVFDVALVLQNPQQGADG